MYPRNIIKCIPDKVTEFKFKDQGSFAFTYNQTSEVKKKYYFILEKTRPPFFGSSGLSGEKNKKVETI